MIRSCGGSILKICNLGPKLGILLSGGVGIAAGNVKIVFDSGPRRASAARED